MEIRGTRLGVPG